MLFTISAIFKHYTAKLNFWVDTLQLASSRFAHGNFLGRCSTGWPSPVLILWVARLVLPATPFSKANISR